MMDDRMYPLSKNYNVKFKIAIRWTHLNAFKRLSRGFQKLHKGLRRNAFSRLVTFFGKRLVATKASSPQPFRV